MATKKKAAAAPDAAPKKKRKRVPPYKQVGIAGSFDSVSDAFGAIEELASECREIVDNASEGLANTQRIQTLGETADNLENISQVDVPECLSDKPLGYSESVCTNKRSTPSRAVRNENAIAILQAAIDTAREFTDEDGYSTDELEEISTFCDELESVIGEIEGCEFPGMFG